MFPFSIQFEQTLSVAHPEQLAEQVLTPMNAFMQKHYIQEVDRDESSLELRAKRLRVRIGNGRYQIPKVVLEALPEGGQLNLRLWVGMGRLMGSLGLTYLVCTLWLGFVQFLDGGKSTQSIVPIAAFLLIAHIIGFSIGYWVTYGKTKAIFHDLVAWSQGLTE